MAAQESDPQQRDQLEEGGNLFPEGAMCQNCVLDEDAVAYCVQCRRLLCDECLNFHRKMVDTRAHEVRDSPMADELRRLYCCPTHADKTVDFFCRTCNVAACMHCQFTRCKEHQVVVSTDVKQDMSVLLERVKQKREEFRHHAEFIESKIVQNRDAYNRCEAEIEDAFDRLAAELEEKKRAVLGTLRDETTKNDERVGKQKEFVRNTIGELDRTIEYTENLLRTKKDAKLMVNNVRACGDLEGRALHEWNMHNATYRCWQLDHRPQGDHASNFGRLLPRPRVEDVILQGLGRGGGEGGEGGGGGAGPHVGIRNEFVIEADIKDQLEAYDPTTVTNFLSVRILFTPRSQGSSPPATATTIQRKITREGSVWRVSYFLRQHGTVEIHASLCGVELPEQPFVLRTDDSRMLIKVGDVVVRGPDWRWENQDGGEGCKGRVVEVRKNGWVNVKWERNAKHDYRWGAQDCYDLRVVPE